MAKTPLENGMREMAVQRSDATPDPQKIADFIAVQRQGIAPAPESIAPAS
jgi:hypothetical protein